MSEGFHQGVAAAGAAEITQPGNRMGRQKDLVADNKSLMNESWLEKRGRQDRVEIWPPAEEWTGGVVRYH